MSGSVTVPSGNNTSITQTFSNSFNSALAKSIADALAAASTVNNLFVQPVNGAGTVPANTSGRIGELFIGPAVTGGVTVPSGSNYSYVVDNSAGPDTIFGASGLSIIGGSGQHFIVDPSLITLGDTTNGGSTVNGGVITVTGSGDNVAVGNSLNTITGTGSGTMSGGFGNNVFIESLGGSYLINSQGFDDTIRAADGGTTVNSSGPGASIVGAKGALTASLSGTSTGSEVIGGSGALTVTVAGSGDTVLGGGGAMTVTVSGSGDTVLGGRGAADVTIAGGASGASINAGTANVTVLDGGTSDTIDAGSSPASVTATGGSYVQAGSGPLNFVGGTGPSTIIGGSGAASVFGTSAATSIRGNAGSDFTYVNTTAGGLRYEAGGGSETLDASLSKASSTIFGGQTPTANELIIGGAGNDLITSSAGSDTLYGGGGANGFYFWASSGGPSANHVIGDFSAADYVLLGNYGPGAAADAIAGAVTAGRSTTITLSDNTKITFSGVTDPAALNGHIFST